MKQPREYSDERRRGQRPHIAKAIAAGRAMHANRAMCARCRRARATCITNDDLRALCGPCSAILRRTHGDRSIAHLEDLKRWALEHLTTNGSIH
jgi:hypothetical protein